MRNFALTALLAACALTAPLALAQPAAKAPAAAATLPAQVKMAGAMMTDKAGKPLYINDMDTMKGMSHCEGDCAKAWPPLMAPAGSKAMGDWTAINRAEGLQWAYKDKPVYTYAKDKAGKPPTGLSGTWKLPK